MYDVVIKGFNTKAEAEEFVKWYEGQGEQDACVWLEIKKDAGVIDVDFMGVDCKKTYPLKWNGNTTTMWIKPQ